MPKVFFLLIPKIVLGLVGVIDLGKQIVLKKFLNFHCVLKDLVLYRGLKKVSFSDQTTMFHSSEISKSYLCLMKMFQNLT